uniref:Uncharacterized protein n=1 Tax=Aegilops tauschii subsp. strangulata TaxID=200361 RepID=A0A453KJB1_AEGTS
FTGNIWLSKETPSLWKCTWLKRSRPKPVRLVVNRCGLGSISPYTLIQALAVLYYFTGSSSCSLLA